MMRKMFQMFTSLVGSINNRIKCIGPLHNNILVPIKQSAMKSQNIQQEILVFTQTTFAQKVLMENIGNNKKSCPAEQLEKAFWNGMLNQMLPELMIPTKRRSPEISIWQICTSECSLLIDMAEAPDIIQDSSSISPFLFLSTPKMN
jgi:hypothetical protein